MLTLLVLAMILLLLPQKGLVWVITRLYRRSMMKVVVEASGKKLKSFKDLTLTKQNKAADAAKED